MLDEAPPSKQHSRQEGPTQSLDSSPKTTVFLLSVVKLIKLVVLLGIMAACVVILVVLAVVGSRSPKC